MGRIWDLVISVPDHCLSWYFLCPYYIFFIHSFTSSCASLSAFSNISLSFTVVISIAINTAFYSLSALFVISVIHIIASPPVYHTWSLCRCRRCPFSVFLQVIHVSATLFYVGYFAQSLKPTFLRSTII